VIIYQAEANNTQGSALAMGSQTGAQSHKSPSLRSRRGCAIACIDALDDVESVLPLGMLAADALGADITLMHVVESNQKQDNLSDPIASDLLHREACLKIDLIAKEWASDIRAIKTVVLEGRPGEQICQWARDHHVDLTIIKSGSDYGACGEYIGDTTRRVMDCVDGSVLLAPAGSASPKKPRCQKILTPLDGSSRAESALPIALRMAKSQGAELVLVHAVPEPELTDIGPREPEDEELRSRITRHNTSVAQIYLKRIKSRLCADSIPVRTVILNGGDVRHLLTRCIRDENADMVIMSSHGQSGHADMTAGSVASHLIRNASKPLMIIRKPLHEGARVHGVRASNPGLRPLMRDVA
jgi:nucleotide-binding universal stress UspA family protein